jgi:cobalt-zinc-cadmium efflux system outer membrane protein
VAAAGALERQARAFANPVVSYQREQTSSGGLASSENLAMLEQSVEFGGIRATRRTIARLRRDAADGRLKLAEAELDFDVTTAYAQAAAADRRATLARDAAAAFSRSQDISQMRLTSGDVSGYAHRRIRLEAARYSGALAEATLSRRVAHLALAALIATSPDSIGELQFTLDEPTQLVVPGLTTDSLRMLALRIRPELLVAALEEEIAAAEARLAMESRSPVPVFSAGFKSEQAAGGGTRNGFVAGLSLPLPLLDRRLGAMDAADADVRRRVSESDGVRRRVFREIEEAVESLRTVDEQLSLLRPQLGAESEAALRAAQVAYDEGEISLAEWLDSVRAYQEAESSYATLRAESLIRRAALERAVGSSLSRE